MIPRRFEQWPPLHLSLFLGGLGESAPANGLNVRLSPLPDGGQLDGQERAGGIDLCVAEDVLEVNLAHRRTFVGLHKWNTNLRSPSHQLDSATTQVEVGIAAQRALLAGCSHEVATIEVRVEKTHVERVECM